MGDEAACWASSSSRMAWYWSTALAERLFRPWIIAASEREAAGRVHRRRVSPRGCRGRGGARRAGDDLPTGQGPPPRSQVPSGMCWLFVVCMHWLNLYCRSTSEKEGRQAAPSVLGGEEEAQREAKRYHYSSARQEDRTDEG